MGDEETTGLYRLTEADIAALSKPGMTAEETRALLTELILKAEREQSAGTN